VLEASIIGGLCFLIETTPWKLTHLEMVSYTLTANPLSGAWLVGAWAVFLVLVFLALHFFLLIENLYNKGIMV